MIPDLKPEDEIHLRLTGNDVRPSRFIEFLRDNLIATEQTRPAIDNSLLMSSIFFTYRPAAQNGTRLGFEARIETITPDHRIFLRQLSDPFLCDLRLWRRVRLDTIPLARAFYNDLEIQIIDISAGGAHLVLRKEDCDVPAPGTVISIKFIFEKGEVPMDGKVQRQWTDAAGKRHIAVEFIDPGDIRKMIY
jgi:hypothetical protein